MSSHLPKKIKNQIEFINTRMINNAKTSSVVVMQLSAAVFDIRSGNLVAIACNKHTSKWRDTSHDSDQWRFKGTFHGTCGTCSFKYDKESQSEASYNDCCQG